MHKPAGKVIILVAVLMVLTAMYLGIADSEYLRLFGEPGMLVAKIRNMGMLGPVLIIGLMTIAIVLNPLPSAPIALTAGAVYGHTLGTIYVVTGAEPGALLAFGIARWAGYDLVRN